MLSSILLLNGATAPFIRPIAMAIVSAAALPPPVGLCGVAGEVGGAAKGAASTVAEAAGAAGLSTASAFGGCTGSLLGRGAVDASCAEGRGEVVAAAGVTGVVVEVAAVEAVAVAVAAVAVAVAAVAAGTEVEGEAPPAAAGVS